MGVLLLAGLILSWKLMGKMPAIHSYLFSFGGAAISVGMILLFTNYARHAPCRCNIYQLPVSLISLAWARIATPMIYVLSLAVAEVIIINLFDGKLDVLDFIVRIFSLSLLMLSVFSYLFFLIDYNSSNRNKYLKWITDFFASLVIFIYCAEGTYLVVDEEATALYNFSFIRPSEAIFGNLPPHVHIAITAAFLIVLFIFADIWAFRRRISYREN